MKTTMFLMLLAGLAVLGMVTSCKKDNDSPEKTQSSTPLTTEQKLTKKWKLTNLVNIGDPQKYLNAVLELKSDKSYLNTAGNPQLPSNDGKWSIAPDSLFLDSGLFAAGSHDRLKITVLDETDLHLSERYAKGGKDGILEYHFKAN